MLKKPSIINKVQGMQENIDEVKHILQTLLTNSTTQQLTSTLPSDQTGTFLYSTQIINLTSIQFCIVVNLLTDMVLQFNYFRSNTPKKAFLALN